MKPTYAILRTNPLRFAEIASAELHNVRKIHVRGADMSMPDGFQVLRLDGPDALFSVLNRIKNSGARKYGNGEVAAFEVVLTFSPEADPMPPPDILKQRGMRFLDRTFGRANVVAAWMHLDESTPHLHALVVPICLAPKRGAPPKNGTAERELAVSWHVFSGSSEREYRNPEKDKRKRAKKKLSLASGPREPVRENKVMAHWQSAWPALWEDYGLRRGLPSHRKHLPMVRIHGELGKIKALADAAIEAVPLAAEALIFAPGELEGFLTNPTPEGLRQLFGRYLQTGMRACLGPLQELAARGIQLEVEKQARADLGDKYNALKVENEKLRAANSKGAEIETLRAENVRLADELVRMREIVSHPDLGMLGTQLSELSSKEYDLLIQAADEARLNVPGPYPVLPNRPPLPTPKPATEVKKEPTK